MRGCPYPLSCVYAYAHISERVLQGSRASGRAGLSISAQLCVCIINAHISERVLQGTRASGRAGLPISAQLCSVRSPIAPNVFFAGFKGIWASGTAHIRSAVYMHMLISLNVFCRVQGHLGEWGCPYPLSCVVYAHPLLRTCFLQGSRASG